LVFTSMSWLFVLSRVIVGAATITKALALGGGYLGRYLRGPSASG
jgi:membrane protein